MPSGGKYVVETRERKPIASFFRRCATRSEVIPLAPRALPKFPPRSGLTTELLERYSRQLCQVTFPSPIDFETRRSIVLVCICTRGSPHSVQGLPFRALLNLLVIISYPSSLSLYHPPFCSRRVLSTLLVTWT